MARFIAGDRLTPEDRAHVLGAYCYRMTKESVKRWPAASEMMIEGGYSLPLVTDEEWLKNTLFQVTRKGRLDKRVNHCITRRG